jgi:ankyrin repeat protein
MEMINALLAAGVDPNSQLNERRPSGQGGRFSDLLLSTGTTPLMHAIVNNDTEVAKVLLEKGANPNIYGMGTTPFLLAAGANPLAGRGGGGGAINVNQEIVDLMIQHGADVNSQIAGTTTYSARVARSPSNNSEGITALHAAVAANNATMVRYLLDHGARVDVVDASGRTPMDVANGVPARAATPGAGGAGVPAANINAPNTQGGRGGGGARGASPEIRTMLLDAAPKKITR